MGLKISGILPNYRNSSLNFFRFLLTDLIEKKTNISKMGPEGGEGRSECDRTYFFLVPKQVPIGYFHNLE